MLQLRPTFSESWYRVVNLRPKLRGTAQISRQYYRGDRWYVVRDPAGNQFHRLSDAAYRFVGLLDGTRTVGEAWDLVGGQLEDDAPTQPEVIQILSQLYAANLIETDIPPDATVLLRRHKVQLKRRIQGRLMNLMFPRIPLWDPDRFLKRWLPVARVLMSKGGAIVWFVVVLGALAALAPEWPRLAAQTKEALNIGANPQNAVYAFGVFWIIKFIHELGHAFACRRFGGEIHEMGIMFLVFIPTPYVDASTAWAFPNKWARVFVGAGGMIVEIFIAALCAFAWLRVPDGSFLSNMLCYAMIIASFTTVAFNANPLLRYDGYYILSDLWEIPNLQQKSREYMWGLIKRHVFRVKSQIPLPPPWQRVQLLVYAICSSIYRVMIGVVIILYVAWQIPILGMLMAIAGVITWVVMPVFKLLKYLLIEPELHRKRGRAWAFCGAVAAAIILLVGLLRFPMTINGDGVLWPKQQEYVRATSPGFVQEIRVKDDQFVKKGDVLVVLRDERVETGIAQVRAELDKLRAEHRLALTKDQSQRQIVERRIDQVEKQIAELERQRDELTIRAPIDGQLVSPHLHQLNGRYVQKGEEIAIVAQLDQLYVYAAFEQSEAQLLFSNRNSTEVRLVGMPQKVLYAEHPEPVPAAQHSVRHPLQTQLGGGALPVDPSDPSRPLVKAFEYRAELQNPGKTYVPGQRAYVRITLDRKPLAWQWMRRFLQIVQSRSGQSKWL